MGLTYQSTRGGEKEVTASMAILQGLCKGRRPVHAVLYSAAGCAP